MKISKGERKGRGLTVGVVVSRFNQEVTKRLLDGALKGLEETGVASRSVIVVSVPGAFEIPSAAQHLAQRRKLDAIVTLGAVIRGETEHFTYVCKAAQEGVMRVSLESGIPITFGVLTTDTVQQALERTGGEWGNKGYEVAQDAVEMANLVKSL